MNEKLPHGKGLVSAVVVTWNSRNDIANCLRSIREQSYSPMESIVVDNSSRDGTADLVKGRSADVTLIRLDRNLGFAHANNIGIENSRGEYVLTVNPDVQLRSDYVEKLVDALNPKEKRVGGATGKLLKEDGATLDSTGLVRGLGMRFFDRGQGERDVGQYDAMPEILGPCAAAALYRREMLEDIRMCGEFFDSSFFAFFEDVDLAYRAGRAGWVSVYVPDAVAVHRRGGSGTSGSTVQFFAFRNRLLLLIKNMPVSELLRQAPFLIFYDLTRLAWVTLFNPQALSSFYQISRNMKGLLRKRRRILSQ